MCADSEPLVLFCLMSIHTGCILSTDTGWLPGTKLSLLFPI